MLTEQDLIALRGRVAELENRVRYLYKNLNIKYVESPSTANTRMGRRNRSAAQGLRRASSTPADSPAGSGEADPSGGDVTISSVVISQGDIRVTVTEAPARTLSGRGGFFSESGLTGELEWTHRDFLGDARSLTASLQGWTGLGAFPSDGYADRRYRAGVSLRQPYVLHRRLSAVGGPFVEYRDDEIETSRRFGADLEARGFPEPAP